MYGPDYYNGNGDIPVSALEIDSLVGWITLKCTEGVSYPFTAWFTEWWPKIAKPRGAYHWLIFAEDGAAQWRYHRQIVDGAGGYRTTDLHPMIDCESGDQGNTTLTRGLVLQRVKEYCDAAHSDGHKVIVYGHSLFGNAGIAKTDLTAAGMDFYWCPTYGPSPAWPCDIWQFTDGVVGPQPHALGGKTGDISQLMLPSLSPLQQGGADVTPEQAQQIADAAAFLTELKKDLGSLPDPKQPASNQGAAQRLAAATLKVEKGGTPAKPHTHAVPASTTGPA